MKSLQAGNEAAEKAAALIEALPWLERFHGATVVLKYGGNAMTDESLRRSFAQDVVFLHYAGLRPVVVHGGGPQINAQLDRLGMQSTFRAGLRVTTPETMDVVRMVLTGQVNREIVGLINEHGPFAVGMSGEDANLLTARRLARRGRRRADRHRRGRRGRVGRSGRDHRAAGGRPDPGHLQRRPRGDRRRAERERRHRGRGRRDRARRGQAGPADGRRGPVPELVGQGRGQRAQARPFSQLTADELAALMPGLSDGMIPKMAACLAAVRAGVPQAHVLDGRLPHAILLEIFTDSGIGTMVVPQPSGTLSGEPQNLSQPQEADHVSD